MGGVGRYFAWLLWWGAVGGELGIWVCVWFGGGACVILWGGLGGGGDFVGGGVLWVVGVFVSFWWVRFWVREGEKEGRVGRWALRGLG